MSEKIYTYLLRIFPAAFRTRYEEEALQLFRDRLSDEEGFSRRLRLCFDLLADSIGALPQAYRNSYAEVAPADLLTPHFDGLPSFQVLRSEPIRRGSVVSAFVLSFLALAAFMYFIEGPVAYHRVVRNGPISPIESVMKNLNQPLTADSEDNEIPSFAVSVAPQVIMPQSEGIRVPAPIASPFNMPAPAAAAVNLSGVWISKTVSSDAGLPRCFVFRQDGTALVGTAGPDSTEQYQIVHASATGDSVTFESNHGPRRFLYSLKVEGGELRGIVSIKTADQVRNAVAWLQRVR